MRMSKDGKTSSKWLYGMGFLGGDAQGNFFVSTRVGEVRIPMADVLCLH